VLSVTFLIWRLHSGHQYFILPEGTQLLPEASVRLSLDQLGYFGIPIAHDVVLRTPNSRVVATARLASERYGEPAEEINIATTTPAQEVVQQESTEDVPVFSGASSALRVPHTNTNNGVIGRQVEEEPATPEDVREVRVPQEALVASPALARAAESPQSEEKSMIPWYLGLGALVGVSAAAAVVSRRLAAREWEIEEIE